MTNRSFINKESFFRGNWDASGGNTPTTGGSGKYGEIIEGDEWRISVGGTISGLNIEITEVGNILRALVDNPADSSDYILYNSRRFNEFPITPSGDPSTDYEVINKKYFEDNAEKSVSQVIALACSDETTNLETGTSSVTFRMPFNFTLVEVRASLTTAPAGSNLIVDINENGVSILSTKISIDVGDKTSKTASTQPVISDDDLSDDSEITIDIDQIGSSTPGSGLKIYLIGKIL